MGNEKPPENTEKQNLQKKEINTLMTSLESKIFSVNFDWLLLNDYVKKETKYSDPLEKDEFVFIGEELRRLLPHLKNNDLDNIVTWLNGRPFNLLGEMYESKSLFMANNYQLMGPAERTRQTNLARSLKVMQKEIDEIKNDIAEIKKRSTIQSHTKNKIKKVKPK